VLHKNEKSGYFVYAGNVFIGKEAKDNAYRKYKATVQKLKKDLHMSGELKASRLFQKHRRTLFNALKYSESVSVAVKISKVYEYILNQSRSVCRFKDFVLKLCIKNKLQELLSRGLLQSDQDITIHVLVDEQLTSSNGYYTLKDSIFEELSVGIHNFNYGVTHSPIFFGKVTVDVQFCDSKTNFLIQASDILANRIWCSYKDNQPDLRKIDNHLDLTFP